MIFDKLTLYNFGVFKGHNEIVFTTSKQNKPVILIGAQNGAGKTTILDALQLVLYGKFARCSKRGNKAYNRFLEESINKSTHKNHGASLELFFRRFEDGIEQKYQIQRKWFQNGKSIKEELIATRNGQLDNVISENWFEFIGEIIPSNIAHFFFFDGEKIEGYADEENSSDLLKVAVHSLLGLDLVNQLQSDLAILERKQRIELKPQEEKDKIFSLEIDLKEIINNREVAAQEKASKVNDLEKLKIKLEKSKKELTDAGGDLLKNKQTLSDDKEKVSKKIIEQRARLRELSSGVAPFFLVKEMLSNIQDQSSIEIKTNEAKAICSALTERDKSLIDFLTKQKLPQDVIKTTSSYLDKNRKSLLEDSKSDCYLNLSASNRKVLDTLMDVELPASYSDISISIDNLHRQQGNLTDIERKLAAIPDEETISDLKKTRDMLSEAISDVEMDILELDKALEIAKREEENKKRERDLLIKNRVINDIENDDIRRTIEYASKTISTLKLFQDELTKHHSDSISQKILLCFKQLTHKDSLVSSLKIDPVSFFIELYDKEDNKLSPNNLSAGERQLLATSILWALAEATGRPLPVVIDTPLGRLDSSHRKNLVEKYFPKASHQVILLSTDEEIDKKLLEILEPEISHKYLLTHSDNTSSSTISTGYFF